MKWRQESGRERGVTYVLNRHCVLPLLVPAAPAPHLQSTTFTTFGDLSPSHPQVSSSCGGPACCCVVVGGSYPPLPPSSTGSCRRCDQGPPPRPVSRVGSREKYVQEAPGKSGPPCVASPGALLMVLLLQATLGITSAKAPPENVETMATWTTQLPCRVRSTDTPQLVLWYRRRENHPFYSYDARSGNLSVASGRVHDDVLGPRSQFLLVKKTYQPGPQDPPGALPVFPGWLELQQVTREDAGGFTCRVDFLDAPTQTHRLHLIVYEKPSAVMVVDGQGRTLPRGPGGVVVAGPFNHGSRPFLTCYVRGGWPAPSVEWVKGGVRLTNASTSVSGGDGSLTNRLYLPPLTAADYLTELQCVVTNNNLTAPILTSVRIDMNIEPTSVLITGAEYALEAGTRQEVKCVSMGSRPPANLTWDLQDEVDWSPLQVTQTVTRTGSSESRVLWTIQPSDDGRRLSCSATNPRNPTYVRTNHTTLAVFHPPIVSLSIGRGLDPSSIKEGGDVYFTCSVTANPPPTRITFYHQGEEVQQGRRGAGAGVVLVTGDSLVLQKVGRRGGGLYSCSAANTRGTETSNVIHLHVLYAPLCQVEEQVVTVTPGENATVVCAVDAYPPPERFSWSLNSTQDGLQAVPRSEFEWSGNMSRFTYPTPPSLTKMMVLCWAVNTLGSTGHPCTTTLIPAGVPERVQRCTVLEQRVSSLRVTCSPGFDGGLRQRFMALVLEPGDQRLVANVTAEEPRFTLGGLAPGFDYVIKVFAFNSRGRSEPYIVDGFSLKVAENRMDSGAAGPSQGASPLLALFIGVLAAFVLTLTVIIVATKLRCRVRVSSRDGAQGGKSEESEDDEESRRGKERRSSAEEKLMTVGRPDCEDLQKAALSQQQQQQHQQQQQQAHQPQQQQQQQHFFGAPASHEVGSPLDYTRLDSKTSDSLYSSCTSNRCDIGYSTESAMLLSSSPSACSPTVGMLVGPSCAGGGEGPASGSGPMMSIMYGSLGRESWGQYSSLGRPPPPAYDAEVGPRFHPLSAGSPCTRRPSESFV